MREGIHSFEPIKFASGCRELQQVCAFRLWNVPEVARDDRLVYKVQADSAESASAGVLCENTVCLKANGVFLMEKSLFFLGFGGRGGSGGARVNPHKYLTAGVGKQLGGDLNISRANSFDAAADFVFIGVAETVGF